MKHPGQIVVTAFRCVGHQVAVGIAVAPGLDEMILPDDADHAGSGLKRPSGLRLLTIRQRLADWIAGR